MMITRWIFIKIFPTVVFFCFISRVFGEKYKFCLVDGKGGFKKSDRYCPILDKSDSKVECVLGLDRLDCLRRISKGKVDFSVFTPEDLVTASNSEIQVLITNELRYTKDTSEYEIVAVANSKIRSRHDLRDKNFCHPGYGYETDWTNILSNYLEASIVPQSCEPKLTITENRIKASSLFFAKACKAGPWVNNSTLDEELKSRYANLCELCVNSKKCSIQDKYWGRRGSLFCLTDGSGDVSWARLDDVKMHFGLVPGNMESSPEGYNFICPDGSVRPVNTTSPCVWAVKPWPVVAAKRTLAQDVQNLISALPHGNDSWQSALLNLIETYHITIEKQEPMEPVEGYLEKATGFLNANSFTGCHPPRTIRICTTSIVENAKCSWLRESAAVYGIEPDLDCLKADNTTHCMQAISNNVADLVMVPANLIHVAVNDYKLKTLFYEIAKFTDEYVTVAVTKDLVKVESFQDFKGKKACFPEYDGVAWRSVLHTLHQKHLLDCPLNRTMLDFFASICAPNSQEKESCNKIYKGDFGAIKCLINGKGDVAFLSRNSLEKFVLDQENRKKLKFSDFNIFCESTFDKGECHLSWSMLGQAMVRSTSSELWIKDTLDVFLQLDGLFGKKYKSLTAPLQIFGPYDGKSNVLFHDNTLKFKATPYLRDFETIPRFYEDLVRKDVVCRSVASKTQKTWMSLALLVFLMLL